MEKKSKKPLFGFISLGIGVAALAASATYFVIKNNEKPAIRDAEYLVSVGEWIMQSESNNEPVDCLSPSGGENSEPTDCISAKSETNSVSENVIWNFTEIGKGTLTTNNHIDDHEFKWTIEDDKLKIETDWLYTLYDELTYKLDQEENTLEITKADGITEQFKPLEKEAE